jgi:hypothetical protein
MGALERLALFTIWTICESKVQNQFFRQPSRMIIAVYGSAITASSTFLSMGMGSPEIIDSSIALSPSVIFRQRGSSHPVLHAINRLLMS